MLLNLLGGSTLQGDAGRDLFCLVAVVYLHPTKEEVYVFARVRLSVCLCARLLKKYVDGFG